MKKLTEKQLWEIIEKLNWKSDYSYYRIQIELSKLSETKFEQLHTFVCDKLNLLNNLHEGTNIGSDDGWYDIRAEIIGRGEDFYKNITSSKLKTMYENNDYRECFMYCFHKGL